MKLSTVVMVLRCGSHRTAVLMTAAIPLVAVFTFSLAALVREAIGPATALYAVAIPTATYTLTLLRVFGKAENQHRAGHQATGASRT
jgi:hypothetical protein